jgi:hypothetical protein
VIARKAVLVRWTSELHRAMQTEIGQQLRSEYELPQELSPELVRCLAQLDKSLSFARGRRQKLRHWFTSLQIGAASVCSAPSLAGRPPARP